MVAVRIVFVFGAGTAGLAGGGQEGEREGLGVEAEGWFHEARAVREGVGGEGREEGLELRQERGDGGGGLGVRDFEGGHVEV